MTTVYIAGPMTGLPGWNYSAFNAAAKTLRDIGIKVENPAEHYGGDTSRPRADYLRAALISVAKADMIALLPGWEKSEGVRRELGVAAACNIPAYRVEDLIDYFTAVALKDLAEASGEVIEMPPAMSADQDLPPRASVLRRAESLVTGDRNNQYGPPTQDFQRTAGVLNALGYRGPDGRLLQAHDTAMLVAAVKLSRLVWSPKKEDNWADLAGYAGCGYECAITEGGE